MLSTINFIIANKGIKCCIRDGYNVNMNMLWIFVGQLLNKQFIRYLIKIKNH